ncbi:uncharacterized protein LOC123534472 isoform X2 [Mercenaria mercenaria]|nr:uncharacterized protein LOC123534472 isoform X2 [Mercenaria mercenaria]XP_053376216.1 uncharacterized protein LOC123534472 isoform X2 [Mercenaria mercenaria]XP_053376217.1 uncharacterized protein LOC123534472 isoform X2 [Mercenaria mercenaria]XP_053376218.1 uncharacterized protein LOC123534472 isoform X2 [Mercenaria mercenaria]
MGKRGPNIKRYVQSPADVAGKRTATDKLNEIKLRNSNSQRKQVGETVNIKDKSAAFSDNIFPHWLPWILFPLTLGIRILYVLEPTNWWILHPDEIFQTIEVAHSDVFGYGFRPYEYLPPPSPDVINSTTLSSAHVQEIQLGMFSLRSYILPKLISGVLILADMSGINASPYLVMKIFHVTVTSLLPVIVFQFSRILHHSSDIGCLSAILVSSSSSLNIFGTHTLINSFLAPFFFLCLLPLVSSLSSLEMLGIGESKQSEVASVEEPSDSRGESRVANGQTVTMSEIHNANGEILGIENDSPKGIYTRSGQFTQESNKTFPSHDENANVIYLKENLSNRRASNIYGLRSTASTSKAIDEQRNQTQIKEVGNGAFIYKINKHEVLAGLGLALSIYVRVDLVFIPLLLSAGFYHFSFKRISETVKLLKYYILGIAAGILIGGYCDYVTYERWFFSPYQWYKFNVRNSFAGEIFGVNSCYFYLLKLYQNEPLVTLSFTILLIHVLDIIHRLFTSSNKHSQSARNQSFIIFIFLLLAFSLNSHKELRLMHNGIIFMYIAVSSAIWSLPSRFSRNQNGCQYSIYIVYLFTALFMSSHCFNFINMKFEDRAKWTYGKNTDSHETNICLDFIRQQKDVTGVFMDRSVHTSGAYSILHHDIPVFALNIFEYMEYRKTITQHTNGAAGLDLFSSKKNGFSTFTNISDFISVYHSQYLSLKVRQTPQYNFLILKTNSNFIDIGYDEMFRVGNSKVLKRTFEKQKEEDLANTTDNIKIFWNATILEYEGSWLIHYGLYTKAEQRLLMSNRIDPRRIGTFRILLSMYSKLKQTDDYRSVLKACLQLYTKKECQQHYTPIMLHSGYYRNKYVQK